MPHNEAQAWWADVQHVRESIERRRAGLSDASAPLGPPEEPRFVRAAAESLPVMDDLDWSSSLPARSRGRGRFEHAEPEERRRPADDWGGYDGAWEDGWSSRRGRGDDRPATRDDDQFDFDAERAALERHADDRHTAREQIVADAEPRAAQTGSAATALAPPPPARRTVQITGRTVSAPPLPRLVEVERRRPARRPAERVGPRPDRIALWAVLLGFFLILVAATSSNAATHPAAADRAAVALHAPAR
jgi:hypothetical protein